MQAISLTAPRLTDGAQILQRSENALTLSLPTAGAGIELPELIGCAERYLTLRLCVRESHSLAFHLRVYEEDAGEDPVFFVRFGVLPGVDTLIAIDTQWMDGHILFPEAVPGSLKMVCHGRRVNREKICRITLESLPCHHDITLDLSELTLTDEYPQGCARGAGKLVDEFGQSLHKDWPGKIRSIRDLQVNLRHARAQSASYPFPWSRWGGSLAHPLTEGTGFFSRIKKDGRWYLVDPEGYAFFSQGPDGVNLGTDCRVDGMEEYLTWLPAETDPEYADLFRRMPRRSAEHRRDGLLFSYPKANLKRALGEAWFESWKQMIPALLKSYGLNTLANWSDPALYGTTDMPYVTSLPRFPRTQVTIFRDFPDVLSPEYEADAQLCAQALEETKNDPWRIGYFLRNEPSWAFVDGLILADEVLHTQSPSVCRERLIAFLQDKYGDISALNEAWGTQFSDFSDLNRPVEKASAFSPEAEGDMRAFSRILLSAYVEIPVKACRAVDPNHMILGMRWAWISDKDLITGWENFDVFSINCYAQDPTPALDNAVQLGVDLPIMIGEFHFGALDAGPSATGLEGVRTQKDRGLAYRYYCERVAAHSHGVGCHYFQCYDQFALGRFDGENYNIGLIDVCSRPYEDMMAQIYACSQRLYDIAAGTLPPTDKQAEFIPMIAY